MKINPKRFARLGQGMLAVLIIAAGIATASLIGQGSLLFAAMPLLMALAALGLPARAAAAVGFIAATAVVAKTLATAFGFEPLSASEWLSGAAFTVGWGLLLAAIAKARRGAKVLAAAMIVAAAPVFIAVGVPLLRSLDTVQRSSVYIPMRDAVKIAADVYLPRGFKSQRLPAILQQTRYFRRIVMHWPYSLLLGGGIRTDIRRYVDNGYAYIYVDARGSGASFGSRKQEWSDDEIRDGAEVVDWIVSQSWSSRAVGATGISYDGTAAEMLLANQHAAVKACALRFSLLDPFADIAFPGGVYLSWFIEFWGAYNDALDRNALTEKLEGFQRRIVKGVAPVDGHEDLLAGAIRDHENNYDVQAFTDSITYRDDVGVEGLEFSRFSPFAKPAIAESGVPIYSYSGWYDGAYNRAAAARFLSYRTPGSRLILGPWDHGGRQNISPHNPPGTPIFDQTGELMRFFDLHLRGRDDGFGSEKPVRYYTMGEEAWKQADTWPPAAELRTLHLAAEHALAETAGREGWDEYRVDLTATTGTGSRWRSYFNPAAVPIGYPDRAQQDRKLLTYTSAPLAEDWEITGHPTITLWVASSASDGQFFAYLEDVSADGKVTYITEGLIRALHRAVNPLPYWHPQPAHSFRKADGQMMKKGEPTEISFALLPTSYRVPKGHLIRVALAGADRDQFAPLPGDAPTWRIYRDAAHPSRIALPIVARATGDSSAARR